MKASNLEVGKTYGTVWGYEMEYLGAETLKFYDEYADCTVAHTKHKFTDGCGSTYLEEEEVERFVCDTVEISTHRLKQLEDGCKVRDDQIHDCERIVTGLIDKIEGMFLDADEEVYDDLLKAASVLRR